MSWHPCSVSISSTRFRFSIAGETLSRRSGDVHVAFTVFPLCLPHRFYVLCLPVAAEPVLAPALGLDFHTLICPLICFVTESAVSSRV